jgi:hypothetical protein
VTRRRAKAGDMYLEFPGWYQAIAPGLASYSGVTPVRLSAGSTPRGNVKVARLTWWTRHFPMGVHEGETPRREATLLPRSLSRHGHELKAKQWSPGLLTQLGGLLASRMMDPLPSQMPPTPVLALTDTRGTLETGPQTDLRSCRNPEPDVVNGRESTGANQLLCKAHLASKDSPHAPCPSISPSLGIPPHVSRFEPPSRVRSSWLVWALRHEYEV